MSPPDVTIRLTADQMQELQQHIDSWFIEGALQGKFTALETAQPTTPQPQPEPPAVGVTVEELRRILLEGPYPGFGLARHLFDHPRLGPLLRGEGRRRGELPEEPTEEAWKAVRGLPSPHEVVLLVWSAARAELARRQGGQE